MTWSIFFLLCIFPCGVWAAYALAYNWICFYFCILSKFNSLEEKKNEKEKKNNIFLLSVGLFISWRHRGGVVGHRFQYYDNWFLFYVFTTIRIKTLIECVYYSHSNKTDDESRTQSNHMWMQKKKTNLKTYQLVCGNFGISRQFVSHFFFFLFHIVFMPTMRYANIFITFLER